MWLALPAACIAAFGVSLLIARTIWGPHYPHARWPRHMAVIELMVDPIDHDAFLARLCGEGQARGYRCRIGDPNANLVPVRYVELWRRDVHLTALTSDPSPTIEVQLFSDARAPARTEEAWVRSL